jgi:hypothetical protein
MQLIVIGAVMLSNATVSVVEPKAKRYDVA